MRKTDNEKARQLTNPLPSILTMDGKRREEEKKTNKRSKLEGVSEKGNERNL